MKTIAVELDDKKIDALNKQANQLGISTQQLINATFDDLLSKPDSDFEKAMNYILKKNKKLYEKLA